jgi:hypothetical protein
MATNGCSTGGTGTLFICSDFDVIPTVLDALNDPSIQQGINRRLGGTCPPELKALPGGGKTTKRRARLRLVGGNR